MEKTFVIIKPDGVSRGLIGEIIKRYEQKGLSITHMELTIADRITAEKHYEEHRGKSFYKDLIGFITSGPLITMVVEGENAVDMVRKLNGATKIEDAAPGTIRGDFATSTARNVVHSSDSNESANREISLWINQPQLVSIRRIR